MKKKLLLILLSVTMVATMMPLSVFAGTQNAQVRTDLGNTGLYLLGDRSAQDGEDYYIGGAGDSIEIKTSGWAIGGQNSTIQIFFGNSGLSRQNTIELVDGLQAKSLSSDGEEAIVKTNGDVSFETGVTLVSGSIVGNGTLNITNGSLKVGRGNGNEFAEIDGPTINVAGSTSEGVPYAVVANCDLNIKSGKVIAVGRNEVLSSLPVLLAAGKIEVGKDAELFISAKEIAVGAIDISSLADRGVVGDAEQKSYDQKDTVVSKVSTVSHPILGIDIQTFAIDETNETVAKTIRTVGGEEPTTTHKVTFMVDDTEYTSQEVADGYCAKMPIDPVEDGYKFTGWYYDKEATEIFDFDTPITSDLTLYAGWEKAAPTPDNPQSGGNAKTGDNTMPIVFIALGFAAAVTGYVAYRKLRNR